MRQIIANSVFREVIKHKTRLLNEDFNILDQKICKIFTCEKPEQLYYIPKISGCKAKNIKAVASRGKLPLIYRKFNYKKKNVYNEKGKEETLNKIDDDDDNIDDGLKKKKDWLKTNREPKELVLKNWVDTMKIRKSSNYNTTDDFIQDWPILSEPIAAELIKHDFDDMKSSLKKELNATTLSKLINELCVVRKKNINETAKNYIEIIKKNNNNNIIIAHQIKLASYLLPPSAQIARGWKPSVAESEDSLMLLASTNDEVDQVIIDRANKLKEYKLTSQPIIVVVGESWTKITDFYTCIDGLKYKFDNLLEALDSLFCCFFVYDLKYPLESKTVCSVISKDLYGFTLNENLIKVNEVLIDLECLRSKQKPEVVTSTVQINNDNNESTSVNDDNDNTEGETSLPTKDGDSSTSPKETDVENDEPPRKRMKPFQFKKKSNTELLQRNKSK
ncbi:hypothetical protein HCN44_004785 [Aphidius gifuensis]|uniref:Uncharacterized protein n=1 Tax=Aphidius gifuensis TaxID=684658 RepID=A0A834XME4_APHGI|nr:uncharacterized protein LOC122859592 isoform X1 [Aphidius gifuensis]KAF7987969.1 hypothetical protein HCN44_004785 [Aphidius gifuensis]